MTDKIEKPAEIDWSLTTWEGSLREQLRRWAELPLERIIAAQEEMADLTRRFSEMRTKGEFSTGSVREPTADYGPEKDKNREP